MLYGSDVHIGDLIQLKDSKENSTGIIIGYRSTVTSVIIGDRFTYTAMVNGQEIHLIREAFDIIRKIEVKTRTNRSIRTGQFRIRLPVQLG